MSKDDASRLRRQLLDAHQQIRRELEPILQERGPLIRGSFGTRARVCGKSTCRCAQGELHESKYLSASDEGRTRQVHVPAADEVRVAQGVDRYRRFREARARLVEKFGDLTRQQLELVDALGQALLEPYPPHDPIPPAGKRGRRPKRSVRAR